MGPRMPTALEGVKLLFVLRGRKIPAEPERLRKMIKPGGESM